MSQLPGPIQKRDILYGVKKPSPQALIEMGRKFEADGWLSDAADFYHQGQDVEALKKLRTLGAQEGNTFLVLKVCRQLNDTDAARDLIIRCAEAAQAAGLSRYAIKAWDAVGMTEKAAEIRATIANDGDIVAEAEQTVFIPESTEELPEDSDE